MVRLYELARLDGAQQEIRLATIEQWSWEMDIRYAEDGWELAEGFIRLL